MGIQLTTTTGSVDSLRRLDRIYQDVLAEVEALGRDIGYGLHPSYWKGPVALRDCGGQLIVGWQHLNALAVNRDAVETVCRRHGFSRVIHEVSVTRHETIDRPYFSARSAA